MTFHPLVNVPSKQITPEAAAFKAGTGMYAFKGKISTDTIISFSDKIIADTKISLLNTVTNDYLVWSLNQIQYAGPEKFGTILEAGISPELTASITYQDVKVDLEIKPDKLQTKVNYLIQRAPTGPVSLNVSTNLRPELREINKINGHAERLTWCGRDGFGYQWERLELTDAVGKHALAYYRQPIDLGGGNWQVDLYIDPETLATAVYPITVDPTTTEITSAAIYIQDYSYGLARMVFNSSIYLAIYGSGASGDTGNVYTSTDPTSSWTNETSSCPFTSSTDYKITSAVILSNHDIIVFGCTNASPGVLYSAKRAANGTWDASKVTISSNVADGFSVCVDENGNVYVMVGDGSSTPFSGRFYKSTDSGANWSAMTSPGVGNADTHSEFCIAADGAGNIHLFYKPSNFNKPRRKIYSISGDSWSGDGDVSAVKVTQSSTNNGPMAAGLDSNGKWHVFFTNYDSPYAYYVTNASGSWADKAYTRMYNASTVFIGSDNTIYATGWSHPTYHYCISSYVSGTTFTNYDASITNNGLCGNKQTIPGLQYGEYLWCFITENSTHHPMFWQDTSKNYPGSTADTTPPYTDGHNPAKDATGIDFDTTIVVHVKDAGDGVDNTTIVMTVEGTTVTPSITGTPADYTVTYTPPAPFTANQQVDVTVDASDLAATPNEMTQDVYHFHITGDVTGPTVDNFSPLDNATSVSRSTNISFDIYDTNTVPQASIQVSLNGSIRGAQNVVVNGAQQSGYAVSFTPITGGFTVSINPDSNFGNGETVAWSITAEDIYENPTTFTTYNFTCYGDFSAPTLSNLSPYLGETEVARNAQVTFTLTDAAGLDLSTLNVGIYVPLSGIQDLHNAIYLGEFQTGFSGSITGGDVVINHSEIWPFDTFGSIYIHCHDIEGNILNYYSENCFKTFVGVPPTFQNFDPAVNETEVAVNNSVYFEVYDASPGPDDSTINVTINGIDVIINGAFQSGYSGTITNSGGGVWAVTINHALSWTVNLLIEVEISCDDLDGKNGTYSYSFRTITSDYIGFCYENKAESATVTVT